MHTASTFADSIVALVGQRGQRQYRFLFNIDTAIRFMKICREAAEAGCIRATLALAEVSYAAYWRMSHGCLPHSMTLTHWPALRIAMQQAGLNVWVIAPDTVYSADGDAIIESVTVVKSNETRHEPDSAGFQNIVADLTSGQAELLYKPGKATGKRRLESVKINRRKVTPGTPAFARLVKQIVDGKFEG